MNWGPLLSALGARRPTPSSRVIDAFDEPAAPEVALWRAAAQAFPLRLHVRAHKPPRPVAELDPMARSVYARLLQWLPTDAAVLEVVDLINRRTRASASSGRVLDTLVTRFPLAHPDKAYYWLDVTDGGPVAAAIRYTPPPAESDGRVYRFFDLGDAYQSRLAQFSKRFFDCFQRDRLVRHPLQAGGEVHFSLCQMVFFTWARRFRVLDFLERHMTEVRHLRRSAVTPGAAGRVTKGGTWLRPRTTQAHARFRASRPPFRPPRPLYRLGAYLARHKSTQSAPK